MSALKDRLVDLGYGAGWRIVRAMPEAAAWRLFRAAADSAAKKDGPGTQRLRQNLCQVVGPHLPPERLDELVRDGLRSYARYWLEAFRLPSLSREEVLRRQGSVGSENLAAAIEAGRGAILALPHSGNWDLAGAWVAANGWKLTTVAERLKPESVYRRFVEYRESVGMEIIPASGGERPPMEVLADRLAAGHAVPLLADRDLSRRGVEVTFFGGRTRMPAGPAILAVRTGAPLMTVSLWYDDYRPMLKISAPLAIPGPEFGPLDVRVRRITQDIADRFAEGIGAHPADWHMLQRLWLAPTAADADPAGTRTG